MSHDSPLNEMAATDELRDAEPADRAIDGATFILDQPPGVGVLWGDGGEVLWADGEALMIAGPQGLCKTTLAGLLVQAQLGLGTGLVLGMKVQPAQRILYLAMDRPRQIARSLRRQFDEADREVLAERLKVLPGPPIADLAAHPTLLVGLADQYGADVVYVDSLKDAALRLSTDEVGASYNRSRQHLLMSGAQICELHHTTKRNPDGGPPTGIASIYGSGWLTSGAGSVVLLSGDPGDPVIGLHHVKQPASEVGPWRLLSDPQAGTLTLDHAADLVDLVTAAGVDGLTARDAAAAVFDTAKPTRAQTEKARRRLEDLTAKGLLVRLDGSKGGSPSAWFLTVEANHEKSRKTTDVQVRGNHGVSGTSTNHAPITQITESNVSAGQEITRQITPVTHPLITFPPASLEAEGGTCERGGTAPDVTTEQAAVGSPSRRTTARRSPKPPKPGFKSALDMCRRCGNHIPTQGHREVCSQ